MTKMRGAELKLQAPGSEMGSLSHSTPRYGRGTTRYGLADFAPECCPGQWHSVPSLFHCSSL